MMFSACQHLIIFYTICLLLAKNLAFRQDWQQKLKSEMARNISVALVEIIGNLFVATAQRRVFNFQIKVMDKNKEHLLEFRKIIDETMSLLNDTITIQLRNGISIRPDNERHFCVLLVDSAESLEYLYKDLHKFHLFVEGSYFIVLQTYPYVQHYYDALFEIFQINWSNGVTHADVLVPAVNNVILLFHSVPFTPFHCGGVAPIIHNKFIDGRWLHQHFYTPKARNLYGCPLVCATWEDMPYFQLDRTSGKSKYLGLEGKLLEYLSEKMNFTVTIRWLNEQEINQTTYDDQGVFDKLFTTNTDFVVGAFHYKPTSLQDSYAPTTAYYLSHYHFIVSSKTDPYDPFTKLLLPFEIEIWLILIFIFVFVNMVLSMAIYLNRKLRPFLLGKENNSPAYNMVVVSLGGPVAKDPKVPFSRFLLMLWLLATFVLRTVYQGFLFHYIKSDLLKPSPRLISDLLQNEYRILMSDVVYISLADLPQLFAKAEVFDTSVLEVFERLRHAKNNEPFKLAVLTALEYYGYYKFTTPVNNDFYIVPQKLFTQQLSIYMKKNSVYLKRFNAYIRNFLSEGLMNHWQRLLVYSGSSRVPKDESPRPMTIIHLYAAIRLLFIGLTTSCLAFFMEIFVFKIKILVRHLQKKFRRRKRNKKFAKKR